MEIVHNEEEILNYMENASRMNPKHPVLIDQYLTGIEIEVDAISDGKTVVHSRGLWNISNGRASTREIRLPFIRRNVSAET